MHFFHFKPNSRKDNTLRLTCAAASGVTLVLCGCMLATPTHAWFTDDRSTGTSVIATGHYDVKVLDQQENTLRQPRVLGLAQEDLHVFNITANGTASTGYCIVTILSPDGTVEDTWYIDPIPQGTTYISPSILDCPSLCGQHKKPPCRKYSVLSGVALRQRCHSCFCLDALIVVKVNVSVD